MRCILFEICVTLLLMLLLLLFVVDDHLRNKTKKTTSNPKWINSIRTRINSKWQMDQNEHEYSSQQNKNQANIRCCIKAIKGSASIFEGALLLNRRINKKSKPIHFAMIMMMRLMLMCTSEESMPLLYTVNIGCYMICQNIIDVMQSEVRPNRTKPNRVNPIE